MPEEKKITDPRVNRRSPDGPWSFASDLITWLAIAFITWFAIHFAPERLHGDAANFLLQVVDSGWFFISNGRWIMPLSQWMAVAGTQLGVPMSGLIALFSLGNVATLVACYAFVRLKLRDHQAGLALVATQMIGLTHALFCPVFEFYFGAMLLVVFLAALRSTQLGTTSRMVLLSALFFLVLSSHFLAMLVAGMTLVLVRVWREPKLAGSLTLVLVVHLVIRMSVLSDYEARAIDTLVVRFHASGWMWVFAPGRLLSHAWHALQHYPDTVLITVLNAALLFRMKDMRGLVLSAGGILVIYVLQSFYFPDGTPRLYREIVDYPFVVWAVVVLYVTIPLGSSTSRPAIIVLGACFLYRSIFPVWASSAYSQRVEWMRDRIVEAHAQGIRRGVIDVLPKFYPQPTGTHHLDPLNAIEVVMLSAEAGPDSTVILFPMTQAMRNDSFDSVIERELIEKEIPLVWRSTSPYFNLPEEPFRLLR